MPDRGTTTSNPNFHSQPNDHADTIVETLGPGVAVQILGALQNSYWPVRLPDGRSGFIHSDLVAINGAVPVQRTGRTTSNPNFHSQPNDHADTIIETLGPGVTVVLLGDPQNR